MLKLKSLLDKYTQTELLLLFLSIEGVGEATVRSIIDIEENKVDPGKFPHKFLSRLKPADIKDFDDYLGKLSSESIHLVSCLDEKYPRLLKNIADYPPILHARGNLDLLNKICISIVGSRKITAYGKMCVREIIEALVNRRAVVVSGMAFGVDEYAHKFTVENGGRTIAVLASGVDVPSPRSNEQLYHSIIKNEGLIVSEQFAGIEPIAGLFPKRNRIISGLSLGTIVIEAGERSGSIITARLAFDQNREVYAVPGDLNRSQSKGTNRIIREGVAKLITSVDEIFDDLGLILGNGSAEKKKYDFASEDEAGLYEVLSREPKSLDELTREIDLSLVHLSDVLTQMELKGMVTTVDSKYQAIL